MSKRTAIYPGSFDPLTMGHVDIVLRAAALFDVVYVSVGVNPRKTPMFSLKERIEMINAVFAQSCELDDVSERIVATHYDGSVIRHASELGVDAIIRGLRALSDFEFEQQFAHTIKSIRPQLEPVFLMTSPANSFVSSSLVKELASIGEPVRNLLPRVVHERVKMKMRLLED